LRQKNAPVRRTAAISAYLPSMDISVSVLKTAVDGAKKVTCPAVGDGSVTVSSTLDTKARLVIEIGLGSGMAITFTCKNGEPIPNG